MSKKFFVLILVLSCLSLFAQQTIKIKPIVGKHSFNLQSQEVGYGIKKHSLCLERMPDNPSDFFLPSDFNVEIDAHPFNPPPQSGKLKINSQKTAEGFLFIANAPKENNFHLHLKKSASENSSYKIELNLTGGKKYQFKVDYVLNGYLLIMGETGNYYEMMDSLSANNYYLEALSLIDDELLKYQGDDQLNWWAEAIVGLFGDLVDVEAIGQIDNNANYFTQMMEGYSSQISSFSLAYWTCGESEAMAKLWQGVFIIISSHQQCNFLQAPISQAKVMFDYFYCKFSVCKDLLNPEDCISSCMPSPDDGQNLAWDCSRKCYEQTDWCGKCRACCDQCHTPGGLANLTCRKECDSRYCVGIPCYLCQLPTPTPPY